MYHINPVETFSKLVERLTFDLILAIFRAKNGQKKWPQGAYIPLTSESSYSELKQHISFEPSGNFQ